MQDYRILLFDVDDTLLDFQQAEQACLTSSFASQAIELTEATRVIYHYQNQLAWKQIEQGTKSKKYWLIWRFEETLRQAKLSGDAVKLDQVFRQSLATQHQLLGESLTVVKELFHANYQLQIVTNGVGKTQRRRLREAGFLPYFTQLFISEELGVEKPNPHFFMHILQANPTYHLSQFLVIGDSLSSDIMGGKRSGLDTVYLTQQLSPSTEFHGTYQIQSLTELPKLLHQVNGIFPKKV